MHFFNFLEQQKLALMIILREMSLLNLKLQVRVTFTAP